MGIISEKLYLINIDRTMDEKTVEDPPEISFSSEESDDEIFFDDDLLDVEEDYDVKIIGDIYEVEVDVMRGDWEVLHDDAAIRTDLIEYFEEEFIRENRKTELRPIQKYQIVDRADRLIRLVHDYARDRMGRDRYESITGRFHPTAPSIAIRKRCFGEVNDLYGPPVEEPFGRTGIANIKYDVSNIHPHVRHYLRGSFINRSLIPVIEDTKKIYTDTFAGSNSIVVEDDGVEEDTQDGRLASFVKESKMIFGPGENSLISLHNVYHPDPPNTRFKKNGMSKDVFESKRMDIEKPFININDPIFNVSTTNYSYWGEDRVLANYMGIHSSSFENHVLKTRHILGPSYRYVDVIREGEIKKISGNNCCIGTVEDSAYENKYKGRRENEEFNYQINNPPIRKEYLDGERVNVSGYMYKTPKITNFTDDGINVVDIINRKPCKEYVYFDVPVDFENVRNNFVVKKLRDLKNRLRDLIKAGERRDTRDITFQHENYYVIDDTLFRFAPHYEGNKFYHGYTVIKDIKNITTSSLYPKDYRIDYSGKCTIVENVINAIVYEFNNLHLPEIYSNRRGHVGTFTEDFSEGDLVLWKTESLTHYEACYRINRIRKIHKTRQKTENGIYYKIELQHVVDDGVEYVLHRDELVGITEVSPGFFGDWVSKHNSIDLKHTYKNKRYHIVDREKFLEDVRSHGLKPQPVLLNSVLPDLNLIVDDIAEIYYDHTRRFGNGAEESNLLKLNTLLSGFGLSLNDLHNNDSVKRLFKIKQELNEQAIKIIRENNETTTINTNTEENINRIIREQDELLYKNLLEILPFSDVVVSEAEITKFIKKLSGMQEKLPSNSRALDVYIEKKGVRNIKSLLNNTEHTFLQNRELYQNYIADLYNLLVHKRPYHMNFSRLSKTSKEALINYSTEIFDVYSEIFEDIGRKMTTTSERNMIIFDHHDYRKLCNKLHASYDNGDFFFILTNLLKLSNELDDTVKDDVEAEDLGRLEQQYKLVRKIYENEREKSQIYKDTCNNVIVVKIYKSREDLEADNYSENVKIDPEFETLAQDMEIYNRVLEDNPDSAEWDDARWTEVLTEKMREYYLFLNGSIIENKVANVLEHRENTINNNKAYRNVRDGEHALLINLYERQLYKRVRNIWVLNETTGMSGTTCSPDELAIVHKSFEEVMADVGSAHSYMKSDYFNSECLPQSVLGWAKRMRDIGDKIESRRDDTTKRADARVLIERYTRQIAHAGRVLKLVKSRNRYFKRLQDKQSEAEVKRVSCPFSKMINAARSRDNIRDMLADMKNLIDDWDWTDVRPVHTEDEADDVLDEGLFTDEYDTNLDDVEAGHTGTKEYLFRGESPEVIAELQTDKVALYSVTDSVVSKQMTDILVRHVKTAGLGDNLTIADGMACVGGNSISFARHPIFKNVISNELDDKRVKMLEHNLKSVLELPNVVVVNSSILDATFLGDIDVLFLDPEWSDKSGKALDKIVIGKTELDKFVESGFNNFERLRIIALKLPYTYDKTLLSKFSSENGYSTHTYYLGDRSNIMYIVIVKNDGGDMIKTEEAIGLAGEFFYPIDSPDPESSKICKHFVACFPVIDMTDDAAYVHLNAVASEWGIYTNGSYICRNCGETITMKENADEQFKTREGTSTVTREAVETTFEYNSMDKLLNVDDERFTRERLMIYRIITDILRVTKISLTRSQLENLVFSGDYAVDYPKTITDIRKVGEGFDSKNTFVITDNLIYKDTMDKSGAGNNKYRLKPYSNLPKIIPFFKNEMKNPKTFEQFTQNWNAYIETMFAAPRFAKYVKHKESLMFSPDNEEDKRFTVETWEDFVFEFIQMRKEIKVKKGPIFGLNSIAAYATLHLYKYYSTLIIRSVSKLVVLLQAEGVRTDDSVNFYGFPMQNLPETYKRYDEDGKLSEYPIPQLVHNIKSLSTDRNRRGQYPWTVFADSNITPELLVKKVKTEIKRVLRAKPGKIDIALRKRVAELHKYDLVQRKLSQWPAFRPRLEIKEPTSWKSRKITNLDLNQLQGYYTRITENILHELYKEIAGENLVNGMNLNNSCCLTNVHLDYERPITNYFAYFADTIGKRNRLVKLFQEAYEVDREIRKVRSRYTIMRFDEPRALREKLLNYLNMNFEEDVTIDGKTYNLKNISLTNNIFLNYCYNEENFGEKRLFKRAVDVDLYLYNEIVAETEDEETEEPIDVEEELRRRIAKKYDGLLSDEEIDRKCETILKYNGEYEICVRSGVRKYDIIRHLEMMIKSGNNTLRDAAKRLNKMIRMENVLEREEVSSTVFYTPETYIDQARDIIATLEILNIHLPSTVCPIVDLLLNGDGSIKGVREKLDKHTSKFRHRIGVEPDDVSFKNWLYSFTAKTINSRVKDDNRVMNELFSKYSDVKKGWTKMIGNMDDVYSYMREKIETDLRILGFGEKRLATETSIENERLENHKNRVGLKDTKGVLVHFRYLIGLFNRICSRGVRVLDDYDINLTDDEKAAVLEAFGSSGFKTRMRERVKYDLPIDIINYFTINEIYPDMSNKSISLMNYETSIKFLKTILIELINGLFVIGDKPIPAKSLDAEYNRHVAKLLEVLFIRRIERNYKMNNTSRDQVEYVNNVLSGVRNKRRLDNYSEVVADKAGGLHKAFRMIGMGREFNAGRGFDGNIAISEIYNADISNFEGEYGDTGTSNADGLGVTGYVAGEDEHDEINGYYGD